jgi:hypothetical protein
MNDEYVVWLLVAALAGVGALLWFLYGRVPREEDDVSAAELAAEASWISDTLADAGAGVDPDTVESVLRLHRRYLAGAVPPREPGDPGWELPEPVGDEPAAPVTPPLTPPSAAHETPMDRDRPRRETPEADIRQAG